MPGCQHCKDAGPKPGWIEIDNNGPIVACPVCNLRGEDERAWDLAEAQRLRQRIAAGEKSSDPL